MRILGPPFKFQVPSQPQTAQIPTHLRVLPPKFLYFVTPPPLPRLFSFVCIFIKNQLNQSEDAIYCHHSSINLLTCPMRFILLTYQVKHTGYPQKYIEAFSILFMQQHFGRHHCIIHFLIMVVHRRGSKGGQNFPFKIKLSTAPLFLFFLFLFSFIYIDCRKLNLQSIYQRFKSHNNNFTIKDQKLWWGHSVEVGVLPKIKNKLRTYSASIELPGNIYFRTDFTYEMATTLHTSLNYTEEKAKQMGATG